MVTYRISLCAAMAFSVDYPSQYRKLPLTLLIHWNKNRTSTTYGILKFPASPIIIPESRCWLERSVSHGK